MNIYIYIYMSVPVCVYIHIKEGWREMRSIYTCTKIFVGILLWAKTRETEEDNGEEGSAGNGARKPKRRCAHEWPGGVWVWNYEARKFIYVGTACSCVSQRPRRTYKREIFIYLRRHDNGESKWYTIKGIYTPWWFHPLYIILESFNINNNKSFIKLFIYF